MTDLRKPECQHPFCGDNCGEEPRGFLTEWEAAPLEPTEDAGNMLAPMWLFDHVAACIRDGKATEEMARNVECLRVGMEAQAARIAELEARVRQQAGFMEAWKDDLTQMALDAKEQRARAEAADAQIAEAKDYAETCNRLMRKAQGDHEAAEAALAEAEARAYARAAAIGYMICAKTRHVSLGNEVEAAIRALAQKEAGE